MKQITLISVIINSFRSFNKVNVQLSTCDGLKLFTGQNLVEPRLGANGTGKSSFLDAIFWCFYGTSLKGLRTSSLVQWNQKLTEVLVELKINDTVEYIYRSGPPNKIEINEQPATQDEINKLIGLTEDQFRHAIVFGQGVPLFPDLSIPERGLLLDSVLNLDVWQKSVETANKKVAELEKQITEKKIWLSRIDGRLTQLPTDQSIQVEIDLWENNKELARRNLDEQILTWDVARDETLKSLKLQSDEWKEVKLAELEKQATEIDLLERELANTEDLLKQLTCINTKKAQEDVANAETLLNTFQKKQTELQTEFKFISKPKGFWLKNNNCPECKQPITDTTKQEHLVEIELKEEELTNGLKALAGSISDTKEILKERKDAFSVLQHLNVENNILEGQYRSSIKRINVEIKRVEALAETSVKEIESGTNPFLEQIKTLENQANPHFVHLSELEKQKNPNIKKLHDNQQARKSLNEDKKVLDDEVQQINSTILATSYWKNGFKRIRLYFIQQILATLQIEIQSAISALGLEGWQVKLSTESETKSGTTKLGVQIHIKSPLNIESSWDVWSGGELQRLRISIAMGLSSLIQRAAGAWYSFEVFDEPSAWLSAEGIEDLLQALQYRAESQKKSIWLVDHRSLIYSGFKEIWMISKEATGSSIQLMEG